MLSLADLELPPLKLFIGNEWMDAASGETLSVIAPATGVVLGQIPSGAAADVDLAVRAAQAERAHEWRALEGAQRGRLIWRLADLMEENLELLAALEALDVGRPIAETLRGEVPLAIEVFRHFAGWADKITGETFALPPVLGSDRFAYTLRQPLGVIGAITPWNAPTMIASWKLAPAWAAGNTVILKPAEDASLSALKLAELALEAGFPPGAINIVTGTGRNAGEALVRHPGVDKITFTGSTSVGRHIGALAGEALKPVDLELGGKSPQIIWPDADLDKAIPAAAASFTFNQGQVCAAAGRIYVHRDVLEEVSRRLQEHLATIVVGDPLDGDTQIGSLINEKQLARVLGYIRGAREEGATLLSGGERVDRAGFYVAPTLFLAGSVELTIAREEVFGPVGLLIPFDDDDAVLQQANSTDYGLIAVLWTNNASRILRFSRELEAGVVWVNQWGPPHPAVPWLGVKSSGLGEELGLAGLLSNTRLKTVHIVSP